MRLFGVFALLCLLSDSSIAQETSSQTALGESLVSAIVSDDIVAYSHCWIASRRTATKLKEIGVELPAEQLKKMHEYNTQRNIIVAESFRKIQSLIKSAKIDRQSIRLKSCKAENIREKKAPKGSITKAGSMKLSSTPSTGARQPAQS